MLDSIIAAFAGRLPDTLGIRFIEVSRERVIADVDVLPAVTTADGRIHGGAVMALADTVGAVGGFAVLPKGATGTTTLESKTNFFATVRAGVVRAEATPLHIGRRTSVWQTRVTGPDGRLLALVTQTQMVLMPQAED